MGDTETFTPRSDPLWVDAEVIHTAETLLARGCALDAALVLLQNTTHEPHTHTHECESVPNAQKRSAPPRTGNSKAERRDVKQDACDIVQTCIQHMQRAPWVILGMHVYVRVYMCARVSACVYVLR